MMRSDARSPGSEAREIAVVLTTVPDRETGERIVRALIDERLIACGNLIPGVLSLYVWEGELAREAEVLVVMKAAGDTTEQLFDRVAQLHPYAVPELVELPVGRVAAAYRNWVIASTGARA